MELVNTARRFITQWLPHHEPPKWLIEFTNQWLPQLVVLLLVILVAQRAAHLTWRLIPLPQTQPVIVTESPAYESSVNQQQTPEQLAKKVADLHLFGIAGAKQSPAKPLSDNKAPETQLQLTLHGVSAEEDPAAGAAIIGKAGSTQTYYRVGAEIMAGVKLQAVYHDRVVLARGGQSEVLNFPKTIKTLGGVDRARSTAARSEANPLKDFREQFRKEPLKIFQYVRFVPVRSGKALKGYRVLPQKNRKLYNQLGLRPSDLITAVNGISLNDDKEAAKLIEQLQEVDQINLDILRRGQPESVTISLN
jgi:general secretion pathway protein C